MIHLNIGSNLSSKFGWRSNNISKAIELLIDRKLKIRKISNFYETPSYPNKKMPKFLNVGILADYKNDFLELCSIISGLNCAKEILFYTQF